MSDKPTETELEQLQTAVSYLADVLEEGSLVEQYDADTREAFSLALRLLLKKVSDLPAETPLHLVQATAVRAIVGAAEETAAIARQEKMLLLERHMREAAMSATLQGHSLSAWQPADEGHMQVMASCQDCGGVVYVSQSAVFSLLPETCTWA